MLKLLALFLSNFTQEKVRSENVLASIQREIFALGFKLLMGVLLVLAMILSILQLGRALHAWLATIENGIIIELLISGTVLVACFIFIFILFYKNFGVSSDKPSPVDHHPAEIDLQVLVAQFALGFIDGLSAHERPKHK